MYLKEQTGITLVGDNEAEFHIPYWVGEHIQWLEPMHKVTAIKFLRNWWKDVQGTALGLKDAKDCVDYILANPTCLRRN